VSNPSAFDFLDGGGEMGALMRAHDWQSSTLGSPDTWPQSLRLTVRLMLNTRHPMFIWWGSDLVQFYNDAYRETMGPERHPVALGARGRECWEEIWHIIGPQIEYVMAGKGSTWDEDRLVPVTRHGRRQNVWWTYSYSPVDLDSAVGGVLVICNDVTVHHVTAETSKIQQERLRLLFEQAPSFIAVLKGPEHTFELTNAAYKRLIGRDVLGKSVRDAVPEAEGQGFFELLDDVYQTGKAHVGRRVPLALQASAGADAKTVFVDFVYQPILEADGSVSGIFVNGSDVTNHIEAESRLELLNGELKHRVKNTIAVISAIAGQTLRGKGKDADLDAFNARLAAFGRAHDILTSTNHTSAPIKDVVKDALLPHHTGAERIEFAGPHIMLGSQQAVSLSLAIHELATNAAKYGALSGVVGKIDINWSKVGAKDAKFEFVCMERAGPPVRKPEKSGFGSQLIRRVLAADFGGKAELSYDSEGVVCRLSAPMERCCPLRSRTLNSQAS
jgi:two-component sensor histidine kinase